MRTLSPLVKSFLNEDFFSTFALIDIVSNVAEFHLTTIPVDITFGGIEYTSDHSLYSLDTPKSSTSVDKASFKLTFVDTDFMFKLLAENAASGGMVKVLTGFYNTTGAVIRSTSGMNFNPDAPILDIKDMFCIYQGEIDQPKYTMSEDQGVLFELNCASPMAALDAVNSFYTSQHSLAQRKPASVVDTCFDKVSISGKTVEILWGKVT